MNQTFQTSRNSERIAFWATFAVGFAACMPGIGQAVTRGWLHPITLLGSALGVSALGLGGAVLLKKRIGPIGNERQALYALIGIMAVKAVLALLFRVIP